MWPLKEVLPANADKVPYVFYDFETTQIMRYSDKAKVKVLNLVRVQLFCAGCEDVEDDVDCVR